MTRQGRRAARAGATARVRAASVSALLALALAGLSSTAVADPGRGVEVDDGGPWRTVLHRAWEASQHLQYVGEVLSVRWADDDPYVSLSQIHRDRDRLTVSGPDRSPISVIDVGGGILDYSQGWLAPLPPEKPVSAAEAVRALEGKYEVALAGDERLLDRPCTRVEVYRRSDGSLRERLWVDEGSGLVLRREAYEGADRRLALLAYLSLDLRPSSVARAGTRVTRGETPEAPRRRTQEISEADDASLSALRRAGWTVPSTLPGGYGPIGIYAAVEGVEGQPLQIVYTDGLYTVSLFQQRGHPDWESLPEGAQRAEDLDWHAYEWPGAVPRRLVWEASGTTFSLVGDAPPGEFVDIAESLPRPQASSLADRLRRGLSRILSWMPQ